MKQYSTVGKTGNVDDYINPGASDELPPPPELADDKEHIRKLQEDIKRYACQDGQLRAQIAVLKREIKRLRGGLLGEKLKDADKPTVRELRGLKRWSCPELARQAGLTYDCVYKRERKVYAWKEEQKKAVAKALGVDVDSVDWEN
ncbi:hypothetical protein [Acidaminococcus massiliensis]